MRHQEIELFITVLFFVAVLFWAHRFNKGGKKFDPKNYGHGPGQFFDNGSFVGNIRTIISALLFIYVGGNADAIANWIYLQFGETLTVSPGKEAWHRVIACTMGIVGIIYSLRNMQLIYAKSKRSALPPSHPEEPSAPSPTDLVDSIVASTKLPHAESEISNSQKRDD